MVVYMACTVSSRHVFMTTLGLDGGSHCVDASVFGVAAAAGTGVADSFNASLCCVAVAVGTGVADSFDASLSEGAVLGPHGVRRAK